MLALSMPRLDPTSYYYSTQRVLAQFEYAWAIDPLDGNRMVRLSDPPSDQAWRVSLVGTRSVSDSFRPYIRLY